MASSNNYFTPVMAEKKRAKPSRKRIIITIVCIFLALVIATCATVGIVIGVINANYVMYLDGIGIDEGVANYFISYHKAKYMQLLSSSVAVSDTPEFWQTVRYSSNTYGSDLEYYTEMCIKNIVAACRIFDMYSSLTSADKENINQATREKLTFTAAGSVARFNELAAERSFDFSDFERATEMLYKAGIVEERIFGDGSSAMAIEEYKSYAESVFANYSRVHLVFVRTESLFLTDSEGNIVYETVNEVDKDGNTITVKRAKTRPLTSDEAARRDEAISLLDDCISGINSGKTAPERFFELLSEYDDGDETMHETGYYFYSESEYTEEFDFKFHEVVEAAYELEVGKCKRVNTEIGECYVYKTERAPEAYTNTSEDFCFYDFYSLVSEGFYAQLLSSMAKTVEKRDKWQSVFSLDIPYATSEFIARL